MWAAGSAPKSSCTGNIRSARWPPSGLKRPVRWAADRTEHFTGDAQGRDNITTAHMAVSQRGKFLGLRIDLKADLGAYLSPFGAVRSVRRRPHVARLLRHPGGACPGPGLLHPYGSGRCLSGRGRPEAAYVIERFVDHIARELGKSPDAIRP